jgi:hypothetical protein
MTHELLTLERIAALVGCTYRTAKKRLAEGGVSPVKVTAKSALYDAPTALAAVLGRTPSRGGGVSAARALDAFSEQLVRRADEAVAAKDLGTLTALVRLSRDLCEAAGVDPHESG